MRGDRLRGKLGRHRVVWAQQLPWSKTILDLPNGIPSHDTFRRVFMLIDPATFEAAFLSWVFTLVEDFDREVVAIDGKTVRRSFNLGREQNPLHLVSAWASEQGLVLGQCCVDSKSNEITAIPALLDQLVVKNSIVTLDEMAAKRRSLRRSSIKGLITCLLLRAITARRTGQLLIISTKPALIEVHRWAGLSLMNSMIATVASCVAGSS